MGKKSGGFNKESPVVYLIGALIGLVGSGLFAGCGCLIERKRSNKAHEENNKHYRVEIDRAGVDVVRLQSIINSIGSQGDLQAETINEYQKICQNLREEYNFEKNEYPIILSHVIELEQLLDEAQKTTYQAAPQVSACIIL